MKKDGFALLIVFLLTFLLSIVTFSLWYKSSFLFDLAVSRERYYKHYYLTQAVFEFAVKYVSKRFDSIMQAGKDFYIQDLSFLFDIIDNKVKEEQKLSSDYLIYLNTSCYKDDLNNILLSIQLFNKEKNEKIFTISCILKRKLIEGDSNNEKKELFIIKNYTLGNIF